MATTSAEALLRIYNRAVDRGSAMTLRDPNPAYTVSTAAVSVAAAVTQTVQTFGLQNRQAVRSGDGSAIGDVATVTMAARGLAWAPVVGHELSIASTTWEITGVQVTTHPDGTALCYDLQVKSGAA